MKKRILAGLMLVCSPCILSGETVYLKDGSKIEGAITRTNKRMIRLDRKNGYLLINKKEIDRIEYSAVSEQVPVSTQAAVQNNPFLERHYRSGVYFQAEYYGLNSLFGTVAADIGDALDDYGYTQYSVKTSYKNGAVGFRVGRWIGAREYFDWGNSFTYLKIPQATFRLSSSGGGLPSLNGEFNYKANLLIYLLEFKKDFEQNQNVFLRVGAAGGAVNISQSTEVTLQSGPSAVIVSRRDSDLKFVYEISPAIVLRSTDFDLLFGLKFVDIADWNPRVINVGVSW